MKFERRASRKDRDDVEALALLWSDKLIGAGKDKLRAKVSFKIPDYARQHQPKNPLPRRQQPRRA